MTKKIALIVGVGQATGQAVCRALTDEYRLLLLARSPEFIGALAAELPDAQAFVCDVSDREAYAEVLSHIRENVGLPERILVNTERAAWGAYNELSLAEMSVSFDVNVVSLLQLVQVLFPAEATIPAGTRIMVSSSPAAYDPPARFLGMGPSRVAQRVLAELLNENLAASGLRFSVFSIDGAIDEPKMRAMLPDKPDSYFIQPADIATEMVAVFEREDFPMASGISGESSFAKR